MLKDVSVFGIGCSGTTALYCLLQKIYQENFGADFRSIYEPFIWDKKIFDCPYKEARGLFGKTSSLSIEGMFKHKSIPMFFDSSNEAVLREDSFFHDFSDRSVYKQPCLIKFIRGNGRMKAFRRLNPGAKFILIIRNPIDSINCSKHKFSYFGEDFYPSDFPRFKAQLKSLGLLKVLPGEECWAIKQAEYCYQMTRAALDFASSDKQTMVIEYEQLKHDKSGVISQLSRFLRFDKKARYLQFLNTQTGPQTAGVSLSENEFNTILPYETYYREACGNHAVEYRKSHQNIVDQYASFTDDIQTEYLGLTTNRLRFIVASQAKEISGLRRQLVETKILKDKKSG